MASENVIDIDALIAPIEGDNPAGNDIRQDASANSIYYKIKDARAGARSSERQLVMDDDPDAASTIVPEWATVLETAPEILKSHAKDLEVAAWYAEGLLRHYGIAGLRDGFRLIHGLVENYWDNLYPMPDEDGIETRVAPLTGLNGEGGEGTLMVPLNKVPLTAGYNGPFATWNYEQALDIEKIADPKKKEARVSSGAITLEMIQQDVKETPPEFYAELKEDLDQCIEIFTTLTAALDERCGHDSPPSSNIRNRLNRIKEVVGFIAKDIGTKPAQEAAPAQPAVQAPTAAPQAAPQAAPTAAASAPAAVSVSIGNTTINSREDAHRIMLKIAEFFRQTEPHSPVSYALEQAVHWSNLSLPELLSELIGDDRARMDYFKLTGIPVDEPAKKRR